MNTQQHEKLKQTVPNFEEDFIRLVDPRTLIYDSVNSQIRQAGHVVTNIPKICSLIQQNNNNAGFLTPVTVRETTSGYELKDGVTRVQGAISAGVDVIPISTYYSDQYGNDAWLWAQFQARANEHPVAQANTEKDMILWLKRAFDNGQLEKEVEIKHSEDPPGFLKAASKWVKENIYPNNPKTTKWIRARLENATASASGVAYENYTSDQALKHFRDYSGTGCTSTNVGPAAASNGIIVRVIGGTSRLNPNQIGYATHDKIEHPALETHWVFYVDRLATATDEGIAKARQEVENFYDKVQKAYNCFGGLWFLPQIKSGIHKEDLNQIIKRR